MASVSKLYDAALADTVRIEGGTVRAAVSRADSARPAYYLVWRTRPSRPWHSEEFHCRRQAHRRFFDLLEQGVEAYLEKRQAARSE
jgi:hypothetical protein